MISISSLFEQNTINTITPERQLNIDRGGLILAGTGAVGAGYLAHKIYKKYKERKSISGE